MNKEQLASYGINYEKGLQNCMGNQDFYKKILSMFIKDQCFHRAEEAYKSGNQKDLFSCLHEMKGISGNSGLSDLYLSCVPIVELLRTGDGEADKVAEMFSSVEEAYTRAYQGITAFLSE